MKSATPRPGHTDNAIEVNDLVKSFRRPGHSPLRAVDHVCLTIPTGSIVAVLGPNGAGKSTTIDMILGMIAPTHGTVSVLGHAPQDAARTNPDVCLLDIEMPGMDGITVAEHLASTAPTCRVLIVTTFGRPGYLRRAMDAGVSGFVVKDTPASELAQAVRKVHQGGRVIDPSLAAESLLEGYNPLTERERGVLREAESGEPIAVIARKLSLSTGTV
ncbi:MAG: response regulator, partial [Propionibacterium sp.]|nr:response regulator [Propionibacterium sp.]